MAEEDFLDTSGNSPGDGMDELLQMFEEDLTVSNSKNDDATDKNSLSSVCFATACNSVSVKFSPVSERDSLSFESLLSGI